jgi:predicted RNase H-like HicB family nuclease
VHYKGGRERGGMRYKIYTEKDGDRYYSYCSQLKGLHIDGDTKEEAEKNAKEAIELYVKSCIKHGDMDVG